MGFEADRVEKVQKLAYLITRYIDVKDPIGSKLLFLSLSAPEKEPIR